jgi:hypothetical protein
MMVAEERWHILELIESGKISVAEGARRLEALAGTAEAAKPLPSHPVMVRHVRQAVLLSGAAILIGGAFLLVSYYTRDVAVSWLVWGWLIFALGVSVILMAWWLHRTHWLFLRVQEHDSPTITLAFPLPLRLLTLLLRTCCRFVPQLWENDVDGLLQALQETGDDLALHIEVYDDDGSTQVELHLGQEVTKWSH